MQKLVALILNASIINYFLHVTKLSLFSFPDMECPEFQIADVELESRMKASRKIGSVASFSCPKGFKLEGNSNLECLSSGNCKGQGFKYYEQNELHVDTDITCILISKWV